MYDRAGLRQVKNATRVSLRSPAARLLLTSPVAGRPDRLVEFLGARGIQWP